MRHPLAAYGVAVAAAAVAVLVRSALDPWLGSFLPFSTLFPAVALVVWFGGWRPATVTTLLGWVGTSYFFVEPRHAIHMAHAHDVVGLAVYLVGCASIVGSAQAMRAARERAAAGEAVLRRGDETLRLAMRSGRMGAWSRDIATNAVWWSRELEEIFGLGPGGFEGTEAGFFEFVHPDDRGAVQRAVQEALESRHDYVVEFRYRHASGEWHWMDGRGLAVYDAAGRPLTVYGLGIDITDRKRAEERFRLAVEAAPSGMVMIDEMGRMVLVNTQAERLFGYSRDELIERPIEMLVPERFRTHHPAHRTGYFAAPEPRVLGEGRDLFGLRKDGTEFPLEIGLNPIEIDGRMFALSSVLDISERKRLLEREQSARAAAEEASRLKDDFLATVSHELRTPLSAILGWARLLREGVLDEAKSRRAAEVVERNAQAQAQLIEDLLDVSRIIAGKLRLDVRPVSPAAAVEGALDAVRHMADAKNVRLQSVLDPLAGPVAGDAGRLQQIVWNLLTNAIKFTPKGGRVQVRVERIDSSVEIVVSDTGQGIAPEFLPHAFDRFRQGDPSPARATGGLGLGLAIVRHLVDLHGGSVRVDSPGIGQGATFAVALPLMVVHALPESGARKPSPAASAGALGEIGRTLMGLRILVVDDEPDTRDLLREVLGRYGAEVREAGSAREALAAIHEWSPALLVSDIGMPSEDGYALIREVRVRERDTRAWLPAIALTAYARGEDRSRALMAGYQAHVAKPVDSTELALVAASVMQRPPLVARPAGAASL